MARKNDNIITQTCTKSGFSITGTADEVAEYFYRDKSTKSGFAVWCKEAERTYNAAYRKALKKAEVERKRDASEEGVVTFDKTMKSAKQRVKRGTYTNRQPKVEVASEEDASKPTTRRKRTIKKA